MIGRSLSPLPHPRLLPRWTALAGVLALAACAQPETGATDSVLDQGAPSFDLAGGGHPGRDLRGGPEDLAISGDLACPVGLSPCGGACVDTQMDRDNCGACGVTCTPGQSCVAAHCTCTNASCTGCCQGDACLPGNADNACGSGGIACNNCNTTKCVNGGCSGCTPGMVQNMACGNCGSMSRTCDMNGVWGSFGACTGEGVCSPGSTRQSACGNCGTETDTCTNACQWSSGSCSGQGPCSPGQSRQAACGNCGMETDTCTNACQWSVGSCNGQGACTPGQTRQSACGNCGTQTDTCTNACQWSAGSCGGQGACTPGQTMRCGNCGTATCTNACQWGACNGQGPCAPGATQGGGCDPCSQQVCNAQCQWNGCSLRPGNACEYRGGTHTRSCTCTRFACGGSPLQWCLNTCQWSTQCDCCNPNCNNLCN